MRYYQKRIKRENRAKLVECLSINPLTFTQLIEKSGLSRSVVGKHLREMEDERTIRREYEGGKLLIKLNKQLSRLADIFLDRLRSINLDLENAAIKGEKLLNDDIFTYAANAFFRIINSFSHAQALILNPIVNKFKQIGIKTKVGTVDLKIGSFKKDKWKIHTTDGTDLSDDLQTQLAIRETNPFSFHIVMKFFEFELKSSVARKQNQSIVYALAKEMKIEKELKNVLHWWNRDVVDYLPGAFLVSQLVQYYRLEYAAAILEQERESESSDL